MTAFYTQVPHRFRQMHITQRFRMTATSYYMPSQSLRLLTTVGGGAATACACFFFFGVFFFLGVFFFFGDFFFFLC